MRPIHLARLAFAGALLTGCTVNITNPLVTGNLITPGKGSPGPEPTAIAASGKPVTPASPGVKPSPKPSTGVACPDAMQTLSITGRVFDAAGQAVYGAKVRISSVELDAPYDSTLDAPGGQYKVNLWPQGQAFTITVTADGYASVVRKVSLPMVPANGCVDTPPIEMVYNFGGPASAQDAASTQFALKPLTTSISAENLSGTWIFADTVEPPAGPVVGCVAANSMTLTQAGTTISGKVSFCNGPCRPGGEDFKGTVDGLSVTMNGTSDPGIPEAGVGVVTYTLKFDPTTQHLVGTKNGQPFWAAPFVAKPDCGPVAL